MADATKVAQRLAGQLAEAAFENAVLRQDLEELQQILTALNNRIQKLEGQDGNDLEGSTVATTEQHSDGAEHWNATSPDHSHDGGIPVRHGEDVPGARVSGN